MRPLVKHTIIIWSEENLAGASLPFLAQQADSGEAHCSQHDREVVNSPENDPNWDGTEFFNSDDKEDGD